MRDEGVDQVERFSTGGPGVGIVGLVGVAAFVVYGMLDPGAGYAPWAWPMLLFIGAVVWIVLVRPAIVLRGDTLEMRNMLHSRWVPLARITDVEVTQVTVVRADDRKYVGSGVGRSQRQIKRDHREGPAARPQDRSYGWLVEERLNRVASNARDLAEGEPPPVRRSWAWVEIVVLAGSAAATGLLALV